MQIPKQVYYCTKTIKQHSFSLRGNPAKVYWDHIKRLFAGAASAEEVSTTFPTQDNLQITV